MNKLKKRSLKALIPTILILLAIAAALLWFSIPSLLQSMEGPMDWEDVDFSGDIEGLYVTGTLSGIYDSYCTKLNDSRRTVSTDYIIDADDTYFLGLHVKADKDLEKAEELMDISWDYLDGRADYSELEEAQYEITGTITKIPSDNLTYYNRYINELTDWTAEEKQAFLPYYLDLNKSGMMTPIVSILLTALGVLLIFIAVLLPLLALKGFYQRSIRKYINASADPDWTTRQVEQFLETTPEVDNLRYNSDFICAQSGSTTLFEETDNLVWAYLHVTTQKQYFITVSKTYELMLGFKNGARQSVAMKREALVEKHIQQLSQIAPHIVTGYTDALDMLFVKNINEFLNLRYNNRENIG